MTDTMTDSDYKWHLDEGPMDEEREAAEMRTRNFPDAETGYLYPDGEHSPADEYHINPVDRPACGDRYAY